MGQKGLQNLIPSFAYIGQNTLACKILGIFKYGFLYCLDDCAPQSKMDKNGMVAPIYSLNCKCIF